MGRKLPAAVEKENSMLEGEVPASVPSPSIPFAEPAMRLFPTPRRRFLAEAGSVAATGALLQTAALAPLPAVAGDLGRARTISIFHTTDLHGRILPTSTYEGLDDVGGFARCATCLRQWRAQSPHSLTVDVGDVVQGTAVSLDRGRTTAPIG